MRQSTIKNNRITKGKKIKQNKNKTEIHQNK